MRRVLIANRGEIAVRIAHTCADAGLESVAIYADPDAEALHVRVADAAYCLQGENLNDTYLNINKILQIALRSGADAVHPGYGFLAERAEFAQAVQDAGLTWIGPSPRTIRLLGDKVAARQLARQVGAPLVRGSDGNVPDAATALEVARELGLPVAIKAAFGGGGHGMRVVHRLEEVEEAFESATREAAAAFGRGECYVEQFLERPRHVEAQILADQHGNVVALGTRDCSLQRRNQKVVEEAPAPFLTPEQELLILRSAEDICRAADYVGAGTVEYLLGASGAISFLEVNTRIQVEHTVTEAVTGLDLVLAQLQIADGGALPVDSTPTPQGHAFQFRLNAEDVGRGFLPATGTVEVFDPPTGIGIRVDSGIHTGSVVTGIYDSMLAKIVVHGISREHALRRARRALAEIRVEGVTTILPFHRAVLEEPSFVSPDRLGVYTTWIDQEFGERVAADPAFQPAVESASRVRFMIDVDGRNMHLGLPVELLRVLTSGGGALALPDQEAAPASDPGAVLAPMPGVLTKVLVDSGSAVVAGDQLGVLEAMKTETPVVAPVDGTVTWQVEVGAQVAVDQELAHIK